MIEVSLLVVVVLVLYNSAIWQKGEWQKGNKILFRNRGKSNGNDIKRYAQK